jgi:ribosomal protein S18 acetylase RimI-like enzyme
LVTVEPLQSRDVAACGAILESLPNWFGIPDSNRAYIASLTELPAFVARSQARIVGFVAIAQHYPHSAEIHVIAVAPELHRHGVGCLLVREAEAWLRARGVVWLHVKTRGPSKPDPFYAKTQQFYEAMGSTPLFETTAFWGERDPTLLLVKCLLPAGHVA